MKKIIMATAASLLLVGCGGGSSTPEDNILPSTSVDDILSKEFSHIKCTNLLGCSSDATFTLTDTTFTGKDDDGNEFIFSYTKESEGNILYQETENWTDYVKILSISDTVVKVCSGNDTLEAAQACNQANEYWVVPTNAEQFIATQNAAMGSVITEKTQITNVSDIQNKFLYQITNGNDGIKKNAIKIASDGKLSFYYASSLSASINLVPDNVDNYYNTSFENSLLHITGKDEGADYDHTYTVNKYNLAGHSISVQDFADEEIFDEYGLADRYPTNKVFSFTSGNLYCTLLWSECWVDEDAMNQIITQSQVSVEDGFTKDFLIAHPFMYSVSTRDGKFNSAATIEIEDPYFQKGDDLNDLTPGGANIYTITPDGEIKVAWADGPTVYYRVVEVTDTYVKSSGRVEGMTIDYNEYWYYDKADAEAKRDALLSL